MSLLRRAIDLFVDVYFGFVSVCVWMSVILIITKVSIFFLYFVCNKKEQKEQQQQIHWSIHDYRNEIYDTQGIHNSIWFSMPSIIHDND